MTESLQDNDVIKTGTRIGIIISGDWEKIPAGTPEEAKAIGNAAKQALKRIARNAIEKTGRIMDIQRGPDVEVDGQEHRSYDVFVLPPFEPSQYRASVALANDIRDGWRPQLGIMDPAIVPHIDTLQLLLLEDIS